MMLCDFILYGRNEITRPYSKPVLREVKCLTCFNPRTVIFTRTHAFVMLQFDSSPHNRSGCQKKIKGWIKLAVLLTVITLSIQKCVSLLKALLFSFPKVYVDYRRGINTIQYLLKLVRFYPLQLPLQK